MAQAQTNSGGKLADFLQPMAEAFKTGEAYIHLFHGLATLDYVKPQVTVSKYIQMVFSQNYKVVAIYNLSGGIRFAAPNQKINFFNILGEPDPDPQGETIMAQPEFAVNILLKLVRKAPARSACVIIERLDDIAGVNVPLDSTLLSLMENIHEAGTDNEVVGLGNPFLMLAPDLQGIRRELYADNSGIKLTAVSKPNREQRKAFVQACQALEPKPIEFEAGFTLDQLGNLSAGMLRRNIESAMLKARANNRTLTQAIVQSVQRETMDIEFGHIVKRVDTPFTLKDLGGLLEFKKYAETRVIKPLQSGDFTGAPANILLVGPPGTGKTFGAMALARQTGLNCLIVDLSMLLDSAVGGTEKNVAKLEQACFENAPCIVIMDEIDQKVRRGQGGQDPGGGGAVENRLFSKILEIFGNPKMIEAGVIGCFMSNLPEQLDPAFMSRMSAVIPFLPPSNDVERAGVLGTILRRYGATVADSEPWLIEQAGRVVNWSGRDLEQVVRDALMTQRLDGVTLAEAVAETITYRRADVVNVVEQVRQALHVCKDSRLVPAAYRDMLSKLDEKAKPKAWNDTPTKRASAELDLKDI